MRKLEIIVLVKQVPDTTEVKIDPKKGTLMREGVKSIMNPDDAVAVEFAVGLKESRKDVVITAVGRARMLKGDMIKDGSILIDLGINPEGRTIVGDVDLESVEGIASGATPTPGGTGPVTVSSMFLNLYKARMLQEGLKIVFKDEMIGTVYGSKED